MSERSRRSGLVGLRRELALAVVLTTVAAGLLLGVADRWRVGASLVGVGALAAAALRLVLPARRAGLLVVRSRRIDVAVLTALGAGLVVLASSVPAPTPVP